MKVLVMGATGTIGRLTVRAALADGHHVTAFARGPERLGLERPDLALFAGDALEPADVSKAVEGQDAVVVVLGSGRSRQGRVRSQGTMNVIRAMQAHGVRRLVCQSTLGAHESWSNLNFFWKHVMFGLVLRPVFQDHELQENLVRASGLDWTLVRPAAFTDRPTAGAFREGFAPDLRGLALKIARADVAGFLGRQLVDTRYLGRAVAISN